MKLILASESPRRAEILRKAGFTFEVRPARISEARLPGESPGDFVLRMALTKASAAADDEIVFDEEMYVIGADTVVVAEGETLGKPSGADDARRMLRLLSGRRHGVLTGVSILRRPEGPKARHLESTLVEFFELSDETIDEYVSTGETLDKAVAYGIQGIGGRFVRRIEGCYFNVMGLPLSRVWASLRELGWKDSF